jgi:hypothetical protein
MNIFYNFLKFKNILLVNRILLEIILGRLLKKIIPKMAHFNNPWRSNSFNNRI